MISNCTREAKWHAQALKGRLWTLPRVLAKGRESPEIGTIQPTKMTKKTGENGDFTNRSGDFASEIGDLTSENWDL